jgi:hypothetical protein
MTTYQMPPQAQPQSIPTPPTGTTTPPTGTTAPPAPVGPAPVGGVATYEAQFLGNLLGTLINTAGPIALNWLRDRVSSMGAAAADETAVAQEVDRFQAQFFGALAPFIPIAINVIGELIRGATGGQAAGGAGAQGAGTAGTGTYVR